MIVAEVQLTTSGNFTGFCHIVSYEALATAEAEYDRLCELFRRSLRHDNDLPETVTLSGINAVTVPLKEIRSVGWSDLDKGNTAHVGVRDAYPHLPGNKR